MEGAWAPTTPPTARGAEAGRRDIAGEEALGGGVLEEERGLEGGREEEVDPLGPPTSLPPPPGEEVSLVRCTRVWRLPVERDLTTGEQE